MTGKLRETQSMDGLTEKQRRFVEAYCGLALGNATEAARLAGYKGSDGTLGVTAHETLKNPKVRRAIEEASAQVRSQAIADRRERMEWLTSVMRGTIKAPKYLMSGECVDAEPDWRERVKACELLGKMSGDFLEKHEVTHAGATVQIYLPDNGSDAP